MAPSLTSRRRLAAYAGYSSSKRELLELRGALDEVEYGILLLDRELCAQYMNLAFRQLWAVSDRMARSCPAVTALMEHAFKTNIWAVSSNELTQRICARVEQLRAGKSDPYELRFRDGRIMRCEASAYSPTADA